MSRACARPALPPLPESGGFSFGRSDDNLAAALTRHGRKRIRSPRRSDMSMNGRGSDCNLERAATAAFAPPRRDEFIRFEAASLPRESCTCSCILISIFAANFHAAASSFTSNRSSSGRTGRRRGRVELCRVARRFCAARSVLQPAKGQGADGFQFIRSLFTQIACLSG